MIVSLLAAGLLLFADAAQTTPNSPPAKPEVRRVCVKVAPDGDTRIPKVMCSLEPVAAASAGKPGETLASNASR